MTTSSAQENTQFVRLAGLLMKIAPHAVRKRFDFEFAPVMLQQFLRTNIHKINAYRERGITQKHFAILYPKDFSVVSSNRFDITLMICLLRRFADLEIRDHLPLDIDYTADADLTRIQYYRNYFIHSTSGQLDENKFAEIWNCVVGAILRLDPDLKSEIDALSADNDKIALKQSKNEMLSTRNWRH